MKKPLGFSVLLLLAVISNAYPDGNDANTILLIHADGADTSTTFTDDSTNANTLTALGNAQVDTAQSVFGGASALFDGSGDEVRADSIAAYAIGAGDYSVDFRFRLVDLNSERGLVHQDGADNLFINIHTAGTGRFDCTTGTTLNDFASGGLNNNQWYHFALTRDSSDAMRCFLDGTQIGTTPTNSGSIGQATHHIGQQQNATYLNGWIDEYRFSNNTRWTANFTPQDHAYHTAGGATAPRRRNRSFIGLFNRDSVGGRQLQY